MVARQRRITDMLMADPAVKTVGVRLGSGRQGSSAQFNIELKSRSDGRRETTAHALARLSAKADRYPDLQLRLRAIQDLPSNDGGQRPGCTAGMAAQASGGIEEEPETA
ncbi:hypothetical protein G6F23_014443 [Rhizopus arrhizus]|nr:hypothetical protein G6F23_014443 [Rhizopus arrhizus]